VSIALASGYIIEFVKGVSTMPLATTREMLAHAMQHHYAIGAYNMHNMEELLAIVEAAEEERAPVIVQVTPDAIRYAGLELVAAMVKAAAGTASVPVALHLDHGADFEINMRAFRAGFTSLMYDGHALPFDENVRTSKSIVDVAHLAGVPVEAELGAVGQAKDNLSREQVVQMMTDPDKAKEFVELTGVDSLAVACGSVHSMTSKTCEMDIDRVKAIHHLLPQTPLVIHGSSGVVEDTLLAAVPYGIAKINVYTWVAQGFIQGLEEGVAKYAGSTNPRQALALSREYSKERVMYKMRLFKTSGRIDSSGGYA
jgi:fructose-bisphosphate aldolase class II